MNNCIPHRGAFNLDTMLPIDKQGNHILYGYRLCGLNDCINSEHVTHNIKAARAKGLRPRPLFHHRNDITGEELAKLVRNMEPGTKPTDYICAVPHCIKPARALHLCNGHHLKFTRWRKANGITRKRMSLNVSDVIAAVQPFHGVNQMKAKDRYCHVAGCSNDYSARGLCKKHHSRYLRAIKQNPALAK